MLTRHVRLALVLRGCKQGCLITYFNIGGKRLNVSKDSLKPFVVHI